MTLIQALPKGRTMELVVEKATELGVSSICPVISARVVPRIKERSRNERRRRWQKIALNAARQCGSSWVPEVARISGYGELVADLEGFDLVLVGSLGDDALPLRSVMRRERQSRPQNVALLIGPEGDLTSTETDAAVAAGAISVRFGAQTMRTETAALYGLSVLAYELQ